jgi:CheY-like chemotaxis protein
MKQHLVIVEDDEQIAWVLTEHLRQERPEAVVHTFFDPFSALEHVRLHAVDLLLTDLHMTGMSGFDLLHRTRQFAPDLPVIMLTADASLEARRAAAHYGVKEYLAKPFEVEALLAAVERLLANPAALAHWPQTLDGQAGSNGRRRFSPGLTSNGEVEIVPLATCSLAGALPEAGVGLVETPAQAANTAPLEELDLLADVGEAVWPNALEASADESEPLTELWAGLEALPRSRPEKHYFPHDQLCRKFSRHLDALHWCALIDFETRTVLGLFEATQPIAGSFAEAELVALAEQLLWPPPLSKIGLYQSAGSQQRAAQEVQLVFPDCVLLARALDEDKFALVLQSSNAQTPAQLWEQVHAGLRAEGLSSDDAGTNPQAGWSEQTLGAHLIPDPAAELPPELLAHFYPVNTEEVLAAPLPYSEPGRDTQPLQLPTPLGAPTADPAADSAELLPHPPWPGRAPAAELVTPMWMADMLLSEIGPYEPRLRTDLLKSKPGVWLYQLGRYCLRTSLQKRYPDRASAEAAMQVCLRDHMALGELHPCDTFFVLTPDATGAYWLWTIAPWLITLEAELTLALKQRDEVALAAGLCKFAEAVLCSLQLALEQRLLLAVEPGNFATLYEGGPLVYVGAEIEHGYCLTDVGQMILTRAEEFAAWPQAVSVYLDVLGVGVCSRFNREKVRQLDLLRSLREVPCTSAYLQSAQTRLIDRIRRCPE